MLEILFRGKRVATGHWIEGSLWMYNETPKILTSANVVVYDVDPETVGQYTGRVDKNGNRVFEGDIVSTRTRRPHIVKFEDGGFNLSGTAIPMRHVDKFEIIGNIHDNPELVEV